MKKIIWFLISHIRQDFNTRLYSFIALFLIVCITINYRYEVEDTIIDSYKGQPSRYLWYFLLYGFAYYGTVVIMQAAGRLRGIFRKKDFWVYSLFGLLLLSIEPEFSYSLAKYAASLDNSLYYWNYKLVDETMPLICNGLPLYAFYRLYDQWADSFYGLTTRNVDVRPYLVMWLIMLPPIIWASFQTDFLETYPTYRLGLPVSQLGLPEWALALIYELAYGSAFIITELVFRGFLVIAVAAVIGSEAILPMVVTYAFLHFGKPLGETIGSVLGGYILGVIALYSRNIWGGVAIHLGVAWMMEIAAWWQRGFG